MVKPNRKFYANMFSSLEDKSYIYLNRGDGQRKILERQTWSYSQYSDAAATYRFFSLFSP